MKKFPISEAHNGMTMVRSIRGASIMPKDITAIMEFAAANNITDISVSSAEGFSKSIIAIKKMAACNACTFFRNGKIVSDNEALHPNYKQFVVACINGSTMNLYGFFPGEVRS